MSKRQPNAVESIRGISFSFLIHDSVNVEEAYHDNARQLCKWRSKVRLVPVDLGLVRTLSWETKVICLRGAELGELGVDVRQMEEGDLLVEDLGQGVNADVELAGLAKLDVLLAECRVFGLEEEDLGEDLVGEGAGHNEGRVASSTAQVDETALG